MSEQRKPRFEHDCEKCAFLGWEGDRDAYFCWQGGNLPTIILRYGDEAWEYDSAVEFFHRLSPELQDRARAVMVEDKDAALILSLLREAGGELHIEQLEHRYYERGGS